MKKKNRVNYKEIKGRDNVTSKREMGTKSGWETLNNLKRKT